MSYSMRCQGVSLSHKLIGWQICESNIFNEAYTQ